MPRLGGIPMPYVDATLIGSRPVVVRGLIDTGAQVSVADDGLLARLGLPPSRGTVASIRAIGGSVIATRLFALTITIADRVGSFQLHDVPQFGPPSVIPYGGVPVLLGQQGLLERLTFVQLGALLQPRVWLSV
jgi:hypothetical protein